MEVEEATLGRRPGVLVDPAREDRADSEGREVGRDEGVTIDEGVRGRNPGVLGVVKPLLGVWRNDTGAPPLF